MLVVGLVVVQGLQQGPDLVVRVWIRRLTEHRLDGLVAVHGLQQGLDLVVIY